MTRERVFENRTVLVRGDRIARIGRAGDVEVPRGALVIDARGKYLMPGLADMHVHVWCEGDLLLYVANGVTTIRNMSGSPRHLKWRERIESGDLLGPALFTSGPIIDADADSRSPVSCDLGRGSGAGDARRRADVNRDRMTKALWDTGQRIFLGTDTANPFLIPGFSIHGELRHLVEAGLTPYEALRSGTHNAAQFLKGRREFGAVSEELRADLILLHANPLEDVGHLEHRVGVMLRGRWYGQAELQSRLEDLASSYAAESKSVEP